MLEIALGGFLVRTGERVVLVDTGIGALDAAGLRGGEFLDNLAALGVSPADVTDVLLTHLHFDHVGWATRHGEIVFPNATYRCDARDWSHFVGPDPGATKKLRPTRGPPRAVEHLGDAVRRGRHDVGPGPHRRAARSSCCRRAPNGRCCSATSCTARSSCSTTSGPG